jgi:hypothetical protein
MTLPLLIVLYIVLIYEPVSIVRIDERYDAMVALVMNGCWNENWKYFNVVYNPFPADISLFAILSIITSLPLISEALFYLIVQSILNVVVLSIYLLTRYITKSKVAALLAILLFILTPATNLTYHPPKWASIALAMITIMLIIKRCIGGFSTSSNILLPTILSFTTSIFFHPTATICIIFLLSTVLVFYIIRKHVKLKTLLVLFVVVFLAKNIYAAGSLEAIIPTLEQFVLILIGEQEIAPHVSTSELLLSPIHAYAWTIILSLASAYIIYSFLDKLWRDEPFLISLYIAGIIFAWVGFLGAIFGFGAVRGPSFAMFSLLAPVAGESAYKILRSRTLLAIILIGLVATAAYIASTDPTINLHLWKTQKGSAIPADIRDYYESQFLIERIPYDRNLFSPHEIASSFAYIAIATEKPLHRFTFSSAPLHRAVVNHLLNKGELFEGIMYIWPERWHSEILSYMNEKGLKFNAYYSSVRYAVFEQI